MKKIFNELRSKLNERESILSAKLQSFVNQQVSSLQSQLDALNKMKTSAENRCAAASKFDFVIFVFFN